MCYTYSLVKGTSAVDKALLTSIKNFTAKLINCLFLLLQKSIGVTFLHKGDFQHFKALLKLWTNTATLKMACSFQ